MQNLPIQGHCRRVPDLVMDFAHAIHGTQDGHSEKYSLMRTV